PERTLDDDNTTYDEYDPRGFRHVLQPHGLRGRPHGNPTEPRHGNEGQGSTGRARPRAPRQARGPRAGSGLRGEAGSPGAPVQESESNARTYPDGGGQGGVEGEPDRTGWADRFERCDPHGPGAPRVGSARSSTRPDPAGDGLRLQRSPRPPSATSSRQLRTRPSHRHSGPEPTA